MCFGQGNPTQMECMSPVCEESTGILSVDLDGAKDLQSQTFTCHANGEPIPFETEDRVLELSPGQDEVSLHVCLLCIFYIFYVWICGIKKMYVEGQSESSVSKQ